MSRCPSRCRIRFCLVMTHKRKPTGWWTTIRSWRRPAIRSRTLVQRRKNLARDLWGSTRWSRPVPTSSGLTTPLCTSNRQCCLGSNPTEPTSSTPRSTRTTI
uniref:(northern house mosquito) hypothetical protein n=1 Tax=Culex pipiens TaxID=7175 RepID=A0A8D8FRJ6_CULPI